MLGQSSFRRVLISRVLLISIPILLVGVAATFHRARKVLLDTARHNLEESAVRKAENIDASLQQLRLVLTTASQTQALQEGDAGRSQAVLDGLVSQMGSGVRCVQLNDVQTGVSLASTCPDTPLPLNLALVESWPNSVANDTTLFDIELLPLSPPLETNPSSPVLVFAKEVQAVVRVPIYNTNGQLQAILTAQSILKPPESSAQRSFLGHTALINPEGTLLVHPLAPPIETFDESSIAPIIRDVQTTPSGVHHLFNFSPDQTEWLAGYSPLILETSPTETEVYAVLALTRLQDALQGLNEITQAIVWVMAGLLGANLLALLYLAKELAEPIEQLGQYALHVHQSDGGDHSSPTFNIRELNNLARALDLMMRRLEERATELETAWQEAEAANQLKSEFLANTSHELRTPLNAIIGCVRLIRDECCDSEEEEAEFLDRAFEAATHLLDIINDLLDIARIEAGTMSLSLEPVNVKTLLQEVIDLETMDIQRKGLTLRSPLDLPSLMVYADSSKLKQVLLNVIFNAIKFTDQGSITIKVRTEALDPSLTDLEAIPAPLQVHPIDQQVVISVEDTGIGIDPAQQHKLFRPFVMVDGSTTRKFEGTGLGLAISRNFMELMGGSIHLTSDGVNQGTTVEMTMPLLKNVSPAPPPPLRPLPSVANPSPVEFPSAESTGRSPIIRSSSQ
jgi:signal transduction histidine kinase